MKTIVSKNRWVAYGNDVYVFRTPEQAQKFVAWLKEEEAKRTQQQMRVRRKGASLGHRSHG